MKIIKKINAALLVNTTLVFMFLLTGCHHENPLKTQPIKDSAVFLMNASANVEKRLKLAISKDSLGFAYLECMEGKKSHEIQCPELLQGIVAFAKENHYPAFKYLTLAHLTDKVVFESIADEYAQTAATLWPQLVDVS